MYVGLMIAVAAVLSATAFAGASKSRFEATLNPIPHNMVADGGSNVTGKASLKVDGTKVHVNIHVRGLTPNLPHAMHIHGILGDANVCPPASADTNGDGLVSLEEGTVLRPDRHLIHDFR
jgi:Cu/Zn superoxide dismutase